MLDFIRLETGDTLVGAAIFKPDHTLWPLKAGNARFLRNATQWGCAYVEPVHVLTYPANDDMAHSGPHGHHAVLH